MTINAAEKVANRRPAGQDCDLRDQGLRPGGLPPSRRSGDPGLGRGRGLPTTCRWRQMYLGARDSCGSPTVPTKSTGSSSQRTSCTSTRPARRGTSGTDRRLGGSPLCRDGPCGGTGRPLAGRALEPEPAVSRAALAPPAARRPPAQATAGQVLRRAARAGRQAPTSPGRRWKPDRRRRRDLRRMTAQPRRRLPLVPRRRPRQPRAGADPRWAGGSELPVPSGRPSSRARRAAANNMLSVTLDARETHGSESQAGEDQGVVRLRDLVGRAVVDDRLERAAGRHEDATLGPLEQVGRYRFTERGRVRHRQDDRSRDVARHLPHDGLGERAASAPRCRPGSSGSTRLTTSARSIPPRSSSRFQAATSDAGRA